MVWLILLLGQIEKYAENKDSEKKKSGEWAQWKNKERRNEGEKEGIKVWEWYSLCACGQTICPIGFASSA